MPQNFVQLTYPFPYKNLSGTTGTSSGGSSATLTGVVTSTTLGVTTLTDPYGNGSKVVTAPPGGNDGYVLTSGGSGTSTSWTSVSSLPAGNASSLLSKTWADPGPIGTTVPSTAKFSRADITPFDTTATASSSTVLTAASSQLQRFTGSLSQNVFLPDTSTLYIGWRVLIKNSASSNPPKAASVNVFTFTAESVASSFYEDEGEFTCTSTANNSVSSWMYSKKVGNGPYLTSLGFLSTSSDTGAVLIQAHPTSTAVWVWTYPPTAGVAGQVLTSQGGANLTWSKPDSSSLLGYTWASPDAIGALAPSTAIFTALTIPSVLTALGGSSLELLNTGTNGLALDYTSSSVNGVLLKVQNTAQWTFTLPSTAGTAGSLLTSQAGAATTWTGLYGAGSSVVTAPSGGTDGYVLTSGGSGTSTTWSSVSSLNPDAATLQTKTWASPDEIGSTTPNNATFKRIYNQSSSIPILTSSYTITPTTPQVLYFSGVQCTVTLPDTATIPLNWSVLLNNTGSVLTVNTFTGVLVCKVFTDDRVELTSISTTINTALAWVYSARKSNSASFNSVNLVNTGGGGSTLITLPSGTFNWSFILPSSAGTLGQVLTSLGGGTMFWDTPSTDASTLQTKTWAAPNPIGSTTPNTGGFTTLSSNGDTNFYNQLVPGTNAMNILAGSNTANGVQLGVSATTRWNWNFPTTAGTTGQYLASGGGASTPMTWTTFKAPVTSIKGPADTFWFAPSAPAALYIKVRMWGAGGGGGGGDGVSPSPTNGDLGTATYMEKNGLTNRVLGGRGGQCITGYGGDAGTLTNTDLGLFIAAWPGSNGGTITNTSPLNGATSLPGAGGVGHPGQAVERYKGNGIAGIPNSGGGGSGGGGQNNFYLAGGGGGSGGYMEFQINNPTGNYNITVGTGGAGGNGAFPGGRGADGWMIITAYFQ